MSTVCQGELMSIAGGAHGRGIAGAVRVSASLAAIMACAFAASARAQEAKTTPAAAAPASGIADIVVTANKRSENLQKTSVAITAVSSDTLVHRGINNINDLTVAIPSAEFAHEGGNSQLYIRGIGSFLDTASMTPLVAFSIDGMNMPREGAANPLFDVAQIEVLPGPQGTLYGRGAAGGSILISNNRPKFINETSGTLEFGNYALNHATFVENLAVSDTLAVRAAGDYLHHSGYQKSGSDNADNGSARLSAVYKPTSQFTAYLWGEYQSVNGTSNINTFPFLHGDPWNDLNPAGMPTPTPDGTKAGMADHTTKLGGEFTYATPAAIITYIPTFVHLDTYEHAQVGSLGNYNQRGASIYDYSQELRAINPAGSKIKWIVGVYWYRQLYKNYFFNFGIQPLNVLYLSYDTPHVVEEAYTAYGQVTYPITDSVRLIAGGRYQNQRKDAIGFADTTVRGPEFTFNHTWNPLSYKAGIEADLAPRVMAYATVQSGWGQGAFNNFASTPGQSNYVAPTRLTAYSGGFKSRWFNNMLQINDEAYYYDYHDLVISSFDGATGGSALYNSPKTKIYGNQLDTIFKPTRSDAFNFNISYLHTAIEGFENNGVLMYKNYQLGFSPSWTIAAGYEHTFNLDSGARVQARVDTRWESGYWATFDHEAFTHQGKFSKTDVSLTYYSANGHWNAAAWAKNLENTAQFGSASGVDANSAIAFILPPRTFGVRFGFNY